MFRGAVVFIVMLGLLACPVWCALGLCSSSDSRSTGQNVSAAASCRGCCSHSVPTSRSSDDDPSSPPKGTPCGGGHQCICGGAVFEQNGDQVVDQYAFELLSPAILAAASDAHVYSPVASFAEDPCRKIVSGRMVCCLYMRFLC